MEDMRRRMEGEMTELEEKMKTITKLMVLKERQTWASERQQLLNEKRMLQKKLSDTEAASSKETMGLSGDEISSLSHQLSSLKEKHDSSRIIFRRELIKERQRAQEEIKERDEVIICLQQRVQALEKDIERTTVSANESSWRDNVSKLEALLCEKDKEVSRANEKRRARTCAHIDTLAQLSEAESALKQSKLTSDALTEKVQQQLSQREESHQKELSEKEHTFRKILAERDEKYMEELSKKVEICQKQFFEREQNLRRQLLEKTNFQKELSETVESSRKELCVLSENFERRNRQWETEKRELEDKQQTTQQTWIQKEAERMEEIQRLTEANLHLQELSTKKKEKRHFWRSMFKK
ncbi:golgin subfamily A member 6-like protein 22 [Scomber scombrus]|uniref:Golgin subfamily A member 6-like protein 22 n=1 Tax=Scomber scombrus TaxID=13677 RepID=A0AAV1PYR1_SCOSC